MDDSSFRERIRSCLPGWTGCIKFILELEEKNEG